jgi:ammonia channel protein AmtB
MLSRDTARKALGAIRIVNGAAGLFAPQLLLRRLGVDTTSPQPGNYPFRMFGIRTMIIGADLWLLRGEDLRRATRTAVLIHATDTVSAAATAVRGDLPRKQAVVATGISAVNTVLALASARS